MNRVSICSRRTLKSLLLTKMTASHILFSYMFFFSRGECIKLMVPHGLLQKNWQDEFHLPANYMVKQPISSYANYSLVFKSNNTEQLCDFVQDCVHSCDSSRIKCYVIYTTLTEPKGALQLCQDDLINFSVNTPLSLDLISTTSGKQVIINETERTRNESSWTFTKIYPMFTLAALEMHPFRMTITNTNSTKAIAYINYQRPKYPFDDYAYEFMVMNHTQYSSSEFGLLLTIGLVIDELRIYPETGDEQY
ncbi:hypothetical protein I4U23_005519 [Adineta vaga]|uniref:Uncharacterized protein n=1 Tax=Adineta vaga TaxID=104782 RepID=B3G4H3_ADIVA|nr:unknown [Adineta vaga]UJR18612.1 hypothetical protein I4U23_005519 [Adineta vaga]